MKVVLNFYSNTYVLRMEFYTNCLDLDLDFPIPHEIVFLGNE